NIFAFDFKNGIARTSLIENLSDRAEHTKEVLKCVDQLKRVDSQRPAAGLSRGCEIILNVMSNELFQTQVVTTIANGLNSTNGSNSSYSDGCFSLSFFKSFTLIKPLALNK
uniref:Uncharacterized protein n=1 Tax=Glossina austeni TaxID=7395 RepID=A0A1A9VFH1_GLOAU